VLLVTGIAGPGPLHQYLAAQAGEVIPMRYPDHHAYTSADIRRISNRFAEIPNPRKIIVTTEKDCQRLVVSGRSGALESLPLYMLPIRFTFDRQDEEAFQQQVLAYCD